MPRRSFLSLLKLLPALFFFSPAPKPKVPSRQMGKVTGQLSPQGYSVFEIVYPVPFGTPPFFFACPTGQGSLFVSRFEANGLTESVASIAAFGEPSSTVSFTWEALTE